MAPDKSFWLKIASSAMAAVVASVVYVHATFLTYRTYHDDQVFLHQRLSNIIDAVQTLYTLRPQTTAASPEENLRLTVDAAWERAKAKAGLPDALSETPLPKVTVQFAVRYVPTLRGPGPRLCGVTEFYFDENRRFAADVRAFVRLDEHSVLAKTLEHEFLHYLWAIRALHDRSFMLAAPNSEEWVESKLPSDASSCPGN